MNQLPLVHTKVLHDFADGRQETAGGMLAGAAAMPYTLQPKKF